MKLPEIKKMHPFMFVGLENNERNPSINSIVNSIVKETGIEFSKIQSRTRKRDILYARHLFCFFARKRTEMSYDAIGGIINRNHATVLHSVKLVEDLMTYDRDFKEIVPKIENLIERYERVETD